MSHKDNFTPDLERIARQVNVSDETDNPEYAELRSDLRSRHEVILKSLRSLAVELMESVQDSIELGNGFLVNRYSEAFVAVGKSITSLQRARV